MLTKGNSGRYVEAPRTEANRQLTMRATRHMAMRTLRIPPVHGQHCNCTRCVKAAR